MLEQVLSLVGLVVVWAGVMTYVIKESAPVPAFNKLTIVLENY